jgi:hypothetical protein
MIILSRVLATKTGFGLVIGFINCLQVVTIINYNTVADFHSTKHSTPIFSVYFQLSSYPFPSNGSQHRNCKNSLNYTLPISLNTKFLLITINTPLPLFLHFMVHCYTYTLVLLLIMQLKHRNERFKSLKILHTKKGFQSHFKSSQGDELSSSTTNSELHFS